MSVSVLVSATMISVLAHYKIIFLYPVFVKDLLDAVKLNSFDFQPGIVIFSHINQVLGEDDLAYMANIISTLNGITNCVLSNQLPPKVGNYKCIKIRSELVAGIVPSSKNLVDGTPKKWLSSKLNFNHRAVNSRVVRTPQYKNFVQSFINSNRAARIVELYLSLLYHSSAGLSWSNMQIF